MKDSRVKATQKFIVGNGDRVSYEEILDSQGCYDECYFDTEHGEYMVLDEEEREHRYVESIENYIDDCILPEIPVCYRYYFDNEAFIDDCRVDGYGHSLACYDGREHEVNVDGTTYYLYRTN